MAGALGLSALLISQTSGQRPIPERASQIRWEYHTLSALPSDEQLLGLGNQGWEMVGIAPKITGGGNSPNETSHVVYFRRPRL